LICSIFLKLNKLEEKFNLLLFLSVEFFRLLQKDPHNSNRQKEQGPGMGTHFLVLNFVTFLKLFLLLEMFF